jgi:PmbA protein
MKKETVNYVQRALDYAAKAGADAADAMFVSDVDVTVGWRNGAQEKLERSESSGLGLRVWVGQKVASVSTGDMQESSLTLLAERAVAMAKVATDDPHNALADSSLWVKDVPDLQLADDYAPDAPELQRAAQVMEDAALSQHGITNSEGADASYSRSYFVLGTSKGFIGESVDTSFSLSVSVLAGEGDEMERDYDYGVGRFWRDLPTPESLGISAAEKALKRLNPRKKSTCKVPLVFDPRVSRGLLSSFASAINGASIVRGTSFLKDAMGQKLFQSGITIMDDPLRVRGLASQSFDAEGVACRPLAIVEDGVLQTWLLDVRSASKLGLITTGHAARGLGSNPSPSSSNFYMEAGEISPTDLIADIQDGFYVTETFGMGVNLVTGDYSQGASGFWIEKGEIVYPVSELTIAGHLRDMFAHLIPANDLTFRYGKNAPTLRIDGMTVAGN